MQIKMVKLSSLNRKSLIKFKEQSRWKDKRELLWLIFLIGLKLAEELGGRAKNLNLEPKLRLIDYKRISEQYPCGNP
jgi:hypothetical protein